MQHWCTRLTQQSRKIQTAFQQRALAALARRHTIVSCWQPTTAVDSLIAQHGQTTSSIWTANGCQLSPLLASHLTAPYATKSAKSKKKSGGGGQEAVEDVTAVDLTATKTLMTKALDRLHTELANIRTGRGAPGMLDHLKVDAYGDRVPLKSLGSVSVRESNLLVVSLFDASTVAAVVKAIVDSPLQLNPQAEGQEILVPVPRPTKEVMEGLKKVAKEEAEAAKVSVRQARKAALDAVKKLPAEDERKREERQVQKLTDEFIEAVDDVFNSKLRELTHL